MEYELVREIQNLCPNNQMRDVFISEVETDDPEGYVRSMIKGSITDLTKSEDAAGNLTFYVNSDGLIQKLIFTPCK